MAGGGARVFQRAHDAISARRTARILHFERSTCT